ncbi:unnamed protein product, partial [marine sediment metagenome]
VFSPEDAELEQVLKLIDLNREANGKRLTILMDGTKDEAVGYLAETDELWSDESNEKGTISTF